MSAENTTGSGSVANQNTERLERLIGSKPTPETDVMDFLIQTGLARFVPEKYRPATHRAYRLMTNHFHANRVDMSKREKILRSHVGFGLKRGYEDFSYPLTIAELRETLNTGRHYTLPMGEKSVVYLEELLQRYGL